MTIQLFQNVENLDAMFRKNAGNQTNTNKKGDSFKSPLRGVYRSRTDDLLHAMQAL